MVLHRVGIFGGAFDPITSGHLTICLEAINSKQIDTVWVVPCGTRPDKPKLTTSAQDRYMMCELAVSTLPLGVPVKVSDCDLSSPSSASELLSRLRTEHPDIAFTQIVGSDRLQDGADLQELRETFDILVVKWPGFKSADLSKYGPRARWLTMQGGCTVTETNASSSEARRRCAQAYAAGGRPADFAALAPLVSALVLAFLKQKHLYRNEATLAEQVQQIRARVEAFVKGQDCARGRVALWLS